MVSERLSIDAPNRSAIVVTCTDMCKVVAQDANAVGASSHCKLGVSMQFQFPTATQRERRGVYRYMLV